MFILLFFTFPQRHLGRKHLPSAIRRFERGHFGLHKMLARLDDGLFGVIFFTLVDVIIDRSIIAALLI
jgi:hypothetical protein